MNGSAKKHNIVAVAKNWCSDLEPVDGQVSYSSIILNILFLFVLINAKYSFYVILLDYLKIDQ